MDKNPKVNIEAVAAAVMRQKERLYKDAECRQYHNIIYLCPGVYELDIDELVSISIRLTGRWSEVSVTGPDITKPHAWLELIIAVSDLLPEFIVEGEEWIDESKDTYEDDVTD